ncbi:MAG: hypothetical protein IKU65_02935 [Oscillospiraceae bacterium]|nr:hypothetical protein [Oscillospiraceae bacterium]
MRNYTEPKLEIVTLEVSDVVTSSAIGFSARFFSGSSVEDAGRYSSLNGFETNSMN